MTQDVKDPFAVEEDFDPFATADEAQSRSGPYVPWPKMMDVENRLVVLATRKFDPEAKVSEYAQRAFGMPATQQEWTVDLVVLDGGRLEYSYQAKVEGAEGLYTEATHVIETLPAVIPSWRVSAGNVIGTLNKITEAGKPFALGRVRAGYTAKEMRAGKTFEQFAAELDAFYKAPRGKQQPKAVWHFVVSDDAADRAVALAWWKAAQADGFKIS